MPTLSIFVWETRPISKKNYVPWKSGTFERFKEIINLVPCFFSPRAKLKEMFKGFEFIIERKMGNGNVQASRMRPQRNALIQQMLGKMRKIFFPRSLQKFEATTRDWFNLPYVNVETIKNNLFKDYNSKKGCLDTTSSLSTMAWDIPPQLRESSKEG